MVEVASITLRDYEARNNESWRSALMLTDANNAAIDLTATTWAMHLRRGGRAPLDLDISSENSRIFLGDTVGTLVIEVAQPDVAHLSGEYLYDLKETVSQRIVQAGKITVTDGETREGDLYATA